MMYAWGAAYPSPYVYAKRIFCRLDLESLGANAFSLSEGNKEVSAGEMRSV